MLTHEKILKNQDTIINFAANLGFANLGIVVPQNSEVTPFDFIADYTENTDDYVINRTIFVGNMQDFFNDVGLGLVDRATIRNIATVLADTEVGNTSQYQLDHTIAIEALSDNHNDFHDYFNANIIEDNDHDDEENVNMEDVEGLESIANQTENPEHQSSEIAVYGIVTNVDGDMEQVCG